MLQHFYDFTTFENENKERKYPENQRRQICLTYRNTIIDKKMCSGNTVQCNSRTLCTQCT